MKWKKFLELQARNPSLLHDLQWRVVLAGREIREFVRTKVGFIAYRPFEKLDLNTKPPMDITRLDRTYACVPAESYVGVEYDLIFHYEGEAPGSCGRIVTSNSMDVGDGSIQAHIDSITRWFESNIKAFQGKRIVWERVIKRTVSGGIYTGLASMNLEIYLFPPAYSPMPAPTTSAQVA